MPLAPGTSIGPYEVLAPLGPGGTGEAYRARDAKLRREVALKILPEALAADPERRARFEREARTLAALNHPHVAQVYGFEESGATHLALTPGNGSSSVRQADASPSTC
jgi:eukaryotic-like serine/threonine-protein kinase